ncbi:MAG: signal recognition particle-docking protein FtsY [Tissierellia bacterium]|nr:signal recognition particle-docking protein FtsY [Tissierellia bacterium]
MLDWFKKKVKSEEVQEKKEEIKDTFDDIKEDLGEGLEDFKKEAKETFSEIKEEINEGLSDFKEESAEVLEAAKEEIRDIKEDIAETFDDKEEEEVIETEKKSFFQRISEGLLKTKKNFSEKIDEVVFSFKKIDEDMFEEIEEILIMADVGVETTMLITDKLRDRINQERNAEPSMVKTFLKEEIGKIMEESVESNDLKLTPSPAVLLVVGVNGVGKTTTIGKLSHKFKSEGKSVLVAAADTFRAAAIDQLEEWGKRAGIDVISHQEGSDPAAVVFDGIHAAKARKIDILIIDTAGRLHNKSNLMNELNKIFRVIDKEYEGATREVLLVLDATTGQNALSQAKTFKEVANVTGIALTKLDGTAKGGIVIALQHELNIPVKLVGVGEGIDDLQPFENKAFVEALFD